MKNILGTELRQTNERAQQLVNEVMHEMRLAIEGVSDWTLAAAIAERAGMRTLEQQIAAGQWESWDIRNPEQMGGAQISLRRINMLGGILPDDAPMQEILGIHVIVYLPAFVPEERTTN